MYCNPCDRWFTDDGFRQHIEYSAAHQILSYDCEICERSFASEESLQQHLANASDHPYCGPCKRMFLNEHNLKQHQHSRAHVGATMNCPFCQSGYATVSGLIVHLESGSCPSTVDRHRLSAAILRLDRNHRITKPQLTMGPYEVKFREATELAWNGYAFGCYLCPKEFGNLYSLNRHLSSPVEEIILRLLEVYESGILKLNNLVHEQDIYNCPKAGCGRTYKLLSGLIMHVESESCGLMRFEQVQRYARGGMVGRLIEGPGVHIKQEVH